MNIPIRVSKRIQEGIKKFKPIITKIKKADVNESDTVTVIVDMLSDILGYDKYNEITSEYAIRKSYCDLAVRLENKLHFLIEVKAVGITLKHDHIKQAVDYGANEGVDWVILTNSENWKIYKMIYSKPIDKELVYEFNLSDLNTTNLSDIEFLYYISKEGVEKEAINSFYEQKRALNRFFLGQSIMTEDVVNAIKKVLKKVSPDVRIENDSIINVLKKEVIKREVLEEPQAAEACKSIAKALKKTTKKEVKL
jgi:hypothetical protein